MKYVYWDSCCFISMLKNEPTAAVFSSIAERAEKGELTIVTSSITIVEVNNIGQGKNTPIEKLRLIGKAFDALNGIMVVDLTRDVAQSAREAVWEYQLKNYDATHLATALYTNSVLKEGICELHSMDEHLLRLAPQIKELPILTPTLEDYPPPQQTLPLA